MIHIVGLDPSLTKTGIAHSSGRCGTVGIEGVTLMSWHNQDAAILQLVDQIENEVFSEGPPALVVIEQLDMATSYGGSLERVALWWQLVQRLDRRGVAVRIAASSIGKMYATGNGSAKKGEVIEAVTRLWPFFEHRGDDNMADAAAFCALGMDIAGVPLTVVNKQQARAVTRTKALDFVPPSKKRKAA